MGKDTKEMLRTILANTQLILKHLNIEAVDKKETKKESSSAQKANAKGLAKKAPVNKKSAVRKK